MAIPAMLASLGAMMASLAGVAVTLNGRASTRSTTNPTPCTTGHRFTRAGAAEYINSGGTWTADTNWADPAEADVGDDFEIRLTVNSGSTPAGSATGTWLALTGTRSWTLTRSSVGTDTSNCTIEIRDAATSTVQDSGTYTFSSTVDF